MVSVSGDTVAVEKARERWEMQRAWAQIRLLPPRIRWYPTRLVLRSHGKEVELGGFLNEAERCQLADELRDAVNDGARASRGN